MKLGIFLLDMKVGGAERVVSYLLHYFSDLDIEVHLILMNPGVQFDFPDNLKVHYIAKSKIDEHGILKFIKIPFLTYTFAKLSKKLNLTPSFILLIRPNYINVLSKIFNNKKCKIIISERSYPSLQYGYKNLTSKLNKYLISKLYSKSDLVICNSFGNANDLRTNFNVPKEIIKVIHNPVDLQKIMKIKPITGFFDSNYFNLVSVGRLDVGKNHELLINAVSNINMVKLYIIGEGRQKTELEKIIKARRLQDKVFLLGYDPNPFKYMKAADLFIFGSNHEGFPNALLEAMSCGLPILSTNCKSGPDEILQLIVPSVNEVMITDYGILVPVNNEELMIKGIHYFLNSPDFLMKCRINVKNRIKHFSKEEILKKYHEHIFQ